MGSNQFLGLEMTCVANVAILNKAQQGMKVVGVWRFYFALFTSIQPPCR